MGEGESASDSNSAPQEGDQEEIEEEEEEDSEDEIYSTKGFDFEDIDAIKKMQKTDPFQDILDLKQQVEIEGILRVLIVFSG